MRIEYCKEARDDLKKLNPSKSKRVIKAIVKVSQNPLPFTEGGYGKPLGSRNNKNLTGFFKIKVGDVRVVYTLHEVKGLMYVIVIAARADDEVYRIAYERK